MIEHPYYESLGLKKPKEISHSRGKEQRSIEVYRGNV